jgi:hypothetical protein
MVVPVLRELAVGTEALTIYTQEDPTFPPGVAARHDADLAVSWHNDTTRCPP